MTERMPGIRLFRRHPEAQERYDGGTGVERLLKASAVMAMEPESRPARYLPRKKHVQADAGKRAEHAVGPAHAASATLSGL